VWLILPPTKVVTFALFSGGTSIFPAALMVTSKSCSVGLAISLPKI
jgi:hypothetical protein